MAQRPLLASTFALRPELKRKLEPLYRLTRPIASPQDLARDEAGEIRAVITLGHVRIHRAFLDALPALGLIASYGAGYEGVDLDAARERGVAITNGAGGNASCVADTAMALLLCLVMRLPAADRLVREGGWDRIPPRDWTRQPGVGGKRLGILGLGSIGARIATRAAVFEVEIGYHNRSPRPDAPYRYFASVLDLAAWADFLVISAPASQSTRAIVDAAVLRALGPAGYLVNIARGGLVDEAALIEALESGAIAGAALDVFADEPGAPAALRAAPNTVLTPHIAGLSARAADNLDALLLENLAAFFAGRPLATPVQG